MSEAFQPSTEKLDKSEKLSEGVKRFRRGVFGGTLAAFALAAGSQVAKAEGGGAEANELAPIIEAAAKAECPTGDVLATLQKKIQSGLEEGIDRMGLAVAIVEAIQEAGTWRENQDMDALATEAYQEQFDTFLEWRTAAIELKGFCDAQLKVAEKLEELGQSDGTDIEEVRIAAEYLDTLVVELDVNNMFDRAADVADDKAETAQNLVGPSVSN